MSGSREEENRKIFESLRDELNKRDLSNTENYDKAILTLSSSSLGLSLTAIKFIVPVTKSICLWLLYVGWISLLISIILAVVAFFCSNKAIEVQLEKAEDYYINDDDGAYHRSNIYEKINSAVNKFTGIFFVIGISSILSFIIINIDNEAHEMSKRGKTFEDSKAVFKNTNTTKVQIKSNDPNLEIHSANIPKMQQKPKQKPESTPKGSGDSNGSSENKK